MGKAYSADFRERIEAHISAGHSRRDASRRFGVSPSFAISRLWKNSMACHFARSVMAGLDPATHGFPQKNYRKQMVMRRRVDARIKSGHDGKGR